MGRGEVRSVHCWRRCSGASDPSCAAFDAVPLLVFGSAFATLLCVAYFLIAHESESRQRHSAIMFAIVSGQSITVVQLVSVINLLTIPWVEPFVALLRMASVVQFGPGSDQCARAVPAG